MKNLILVIHVFASLLMLSGCAGNARSQIDIAIYDLGPPVAALPGAAEANAGVALELRLPLWMDSQSMSYRMGYVDVQRLRTYSQARWAGQPALMLQQRLRQRLAIAPGGAPCTLRVELDDFTQVFNSPGSSHAVVSGVALLNGKGRAVIARLPLRFEVAAASADAQGGVAALATATENMSMALSQWLEKQSSSLSVCRNPA